MRRALRAILGGLTAALALAFAPAALAGPFSDWAVIVVAGDYHASGGMETEAFDNARHDVVQALVDHGFTAGNIRQFSVRPERYEPRPDPTDYSTIGEELSDAARTARGGCLIYFTSHGSPMGIVLGQVLMPPWALSGIIDNACGQRPTIVILSACFSGVFVEPLSGPNRVILTAARPDRTSFGCGVNNRYPYFDDCFLQVIPTAHDFGTLGPAVQSCVSQREQSEGMAPPSEPQFWVDPSFRPMLPLYPLAQPPPPAPRRR